MFFQAPKRGGLSRPGTPVRNFQITASTNSLIAKIAVAPNVSRTPRQLFFNPRELVVPQSVTVHQEALERRLPTNHAFSDSRIRQDKRIFPHIISVIQRSI